jgi:hypothetical protein
MMVILNEASAGKGSSSDKNKPVNDWHTSGKYMISLIINQYRALKYIHPDSEGKEMHKRLNRQGYITRICFTGFQLFIEPAVK